MNEQWFRKRKDSRGWYPASWQAWMVVTLFCVSLIMLFMEIDRHAHSVSDTLMSFAPRAFFLSGVFFLIMAYTREK